MRKTFPSALVVLALATAFLAAAQAAAAPPSPAESVQHPPVAVPERPMVPAVPKVYSTTPAGTLLLSMDTWQAFPVSGWPFSACTNSLVKNWDGWPIVKGTSAYTGKLMVWPDNPDSSTPQCPSGQVRRKYWVVLDGQPEPGDYEVKLGPAPPGTVLVPLILRVPGAAYQRNVIRRPARPL